MKHDFSPLYRALLLVLACVILRMLNSAFPEVVPNVSPLMALAYVGAMYLPRAWGWLVGPVALLVTDLAFVKVNYLTGGTGSMFSWWTALALTTYALAGVFGLWIARRKSLVKILAGSVACSLVFYVAANTFAWWSDVVFHVTPGYPATLLGWWQANTVGEAGSPPSWLFLRNGVAGDLFFTLVLLLVLDRQLLFGHAADKAAPRAA
ncbi:MAG: DUF6580 family putative transport protein [Verrucomicrobiota bacterium]